MRLVHLADLHLGFRQYDRLTQNCINQREADVANTFRGAVDRIVALRPDVVLIAGDIFHSVRPMNPAIIHAFNQFARLTQALPETIVAMIAGNHDRPRATETGCILRLFSPLGIHVVDAEPRRLAFSERDLAILAVPDMSGPHPVLLPEPAARNNILLLHGEVEGIIPGEAVREERGAMAISKEALGTQRWGYVALGHYHVHRQIAPNAFYCGSIDYTSSNPWGEIVEERETGLAGKGFIEYDLDSATARFHPIEPSRRFLDLPAISARGRTAAEVDAAVGESVGRCEGGIDDAIVRVVVRDLPRHIARELDHKTLREYKRRALHFHLDARRPEVLRISASGTAGHRPTLAEVVEAYLSRRPLESDIDRGSLVRLGRQYLDEADAATVPATAMSG